MGETHDKNPAGVKTGVETGDSSGTGANAGEGLAGIQALDHLLRRGRPDVNAVAAIIIAHPYDRDPLIARLHQTLGNNYVGQVVALVASGAGSASSAPQTASHQHDPINKQDAKGAVASSVVAAPIGSTSTTNASLDPELRDVESGLAVATTIRNTLLPAHRAAVNALEPGAVIEIATRAIMLFQSARNAEAKASEKIAKGLPAASVSTVDSLTIDSPDQLEARWATLVGLDSLLKVGDVTLATELAIALGPQEFRGARVAGELGVPAMGDNPVQFLVHEAGTTVDLITVTRRIQSLAGSNDGTCVPLTDDKRTEIAKLVEPFRTRPVNFAFLVHAMGDEIWNEVSAAKGDSGRSLQSTFEKTKVQAKATGALADVGDYDPELIEKLLPVDGVAGFALEQYPAMATGGAHLAFEQIVSAAPNARGPIIRHLAATKRLELVFSGLAWKQVEALANKVREFDKHAAGLLAQFYVDRGSERSMQQIYDDATDDQLAQGDIVGAYRTFTVGRIHNFTTTGFVEVNSKSFEERAQGYIGDAEYASSTANAMGKTAVVSAAGALTGGLGGGAAGGLAPAALGEGGASLIAGAVGGVTAGLGGHLAGDLYDQKFNGKEGFDDAGSYAMSGLMGGGMGVALAGVSLATAKFYPEEAQTMAVTYAKRYPHMVKLLEGARNFGVGTRQLVVMSGRALKSLFAGGGMGPPGSALAPIGGDLASIPDDATVRVRFRARVDINRPMMSEHHGADDRDGDSIFEIDDLEILGYGSRDIEDMDLASLGDEDESAEVASVGSRTPRWNEETQEREVSAPSSQGARAAGVVPNPGDEITDQHHVFPVEERGWFTDRGIDIDDYTVDMTPPKHQAQHGGAAWKLARTRAVLLKWKHWNRLIMHNLREAELALGENLPAEQIIEIGQDTMRDRGIVGEFKRYTGGHR